MKILGKTVSNKFQSFYKDIVSRINAPIQFERNPYRAMGDYKLENGIARIRLDTGLIRPHFEETAAHELLHAVQDLEFWPNTAWSANLPDDSPEAMVGSELAALVRDLNVLETLQTLGFNSDYSNDARYRNSKNNLAKAPVPPQGSPLSYMWTLRYCYLAMTQRPNRWARLRELYRKRAPSITAKGEELIGIIKKNGWSNPDQAFASMISIRNSLGLTQKQVIIVDARTGSRY
ncbi:hypothetical protein ES708_28733 [subsurface metagenome]